MFTRRAFVSPSVVDAKGVLDAVVRWTQSLNDKAALEIAQARIAADQGIAFPATQVDSTDVNTLDDYEEGTWTPVVTFAVPGDLAVTYANQTADYTKIGRVVIATFGFTTSSFTFTTATGNLKVTGLPFAASSDSTYFATGALSWAGITMAGYTNITARIGPSNSFVDFVGSGSGVGRSFVNSTQTPSGGTVQFTCQITYRV